MFLHTAVFARLMCNMELKLRFGELNFVEFVWKTETRERKLYLTL